MPSKQVVLKNTIGLTPLNTGERRSPRLPEEWFTRGVELTAAQHYTDAERCFREALVIVPDSQETLLNLGYVLGQQGRMDEALSCYESVLAISPENAKARYNRGIHRLRSGDFINGFDDYEFRFLALQNTDSRVYTQPRWDGSPLDGQYLLVYCEQGFGDAIQFSRYIPLVTELGGRVMLEVQPSMLSLMSTVSGVEKIVAKTAIPPSTDFHIPLLSLPYIFGTTLDAVPPPIPSLVPDPNKVSAWCQLLSRDTKFRIGLVWRGSPSNPMDLDRSCPLAEVATLLDIPGISYYSLQVGSAADEIKSLSQSTGLINLAEHLKDFSDTAALIVNLDLIISVDTSVAHLAGALGKPVWVLLAHTPDWRWMLNRNDSPWYPTMRLFRQSQPGDWHSVVADVAQSLGVELQQKQGIKLSTDKQEILFRSALHSLGVRDSATAICNLNQLLIQDGDDPAIWFNLGRAYDMSGQLTEAEHCYRQALLQKPDSAAIWFGIANIQLRRSEFVLAEAYLRQAHMYSPESLDILFALNAALISQNKSEEALHNCQKILLLKPDSIEAIYDISYAQLCRGEYLAGFTNFEARLSIERFQIDPRRYSQPRWDGSHLEGKSILVIGEQGMGDVIHFSRYLPLLAERGGEIVLEVPPLLTKLFVGMPSVRQVLAKSKTSPLTDYYIQLMSLPHLFGTTLTTVPSMVPYIKADPFKRAYWQSQMPNTSEFRVGLVWRGNPNQKNDKTRSCPFGELTPLTTLPGVRFYSLQVGAGQDELGSSSEWVQHFDFTTHLHDFSDTAALIANLDLVIGVDTAVTHLAGALGKPVWVLLAHIPEWRWLVNWNLSPWYPTMRLFRQEQADDWRGTVMLIKNTLELLLAERCV